MRPWMAYVYDRCFVAMAKDRTDAQIAIRNQVMISGIAAENVQIQPFKL